MIVKRKNSPYIKNIVNIKSLNYWQNSNSGGIFYKKKGKMEDIQKKFIQAWENGVTGKELCKQFNICKSTAYNRFKLHLPIKRPDIEFCKLNLAFEGDWRGGQVPLEICKSYRKRRC